MFNRSGTNQYSHGALHQVIRQKCWKEDKHGIWWNKRVLCCQFLNYYNALMSKTHIYYSHIILLELKIVSI